MSALALTGSAPALAAPTSYTASALITGSPLTDADGVAVSGSTTYVLDGSAKKVYVYASGAITNTIDLSAVTNASGTVLTLSSTASDIAVDATKLYIADTGNSRVVSTPLAAPTSFTVEAGTGVQGGTFDGTVAASQLSNPRGIAIVGSDLYIADTGHHQVLKRTGSALTIVAGNAQTPPASATSTNLSSPSDVAVDGAGSIYISDTGFGRIVRVGTGGSLATIATVASPGSLAVAADTLAVASGSSVQTLSTSGGNTATVTAGLTPALTATSGVALSSTGDVTVAEPAGTSSRLVRATATGSSATAPVMAAAMTITTLTSKEFTRTFSAGGSPAPIYSIVEQSAATGAPVLSIDSATGVLKGTPTAAGTFTYKVQAANSEGRPLTIVTLNVGAVPAKPAAAPKATPGQGSATVTWAAPTPSASASPSPSASPGLSDAITGYTVTPFVNGVAGTPVTASATATSTVVSGLSSGTAYTFKVAATNAFGTSELSDASTAVTPFGGFVQPAAGLTRYEGGTRVQTAVSVSRKLFPDTGSSRAVVIASSTNYADSLAGARLASAVGGPLLLTDPLALNTEVASEVARVLAVPAAAAAGSTPAASAGSAPSQTAVGTVYLLGGTSAVSAAVETAVKAVNAKYTVTRISGTDRFDTAVKIAAQTAADDGGASAPIYVASGTNYPDGLAVAALAARTGGVVLLTDGSKMPDATLKYLQTYDPNSELLVAVGGPAAKATSGHGADRAVVGTDRYDTARRVAELFTAPTGSAPVRSVGLATGDNWPDALAGAAAMGNLDGPLLLTPSGALSPSTSSALTALAKKGRPTSALVFGGSSVVSTGTANDFTSGATR